MVVVEVVGPAGLSPGRVAKTSERFSDSTKVYPPRQIKRNEELSLRHRASASTGHINIESRRHARAPCISADIVRPTDPSCCAASRVAEPWARHAVGCPFPAHLSRGNPRASICHPSSRERLARLRDSIEDALFVSLRMGHPLRRVTVPGAGGHREFANAGTHQPGIADSSAWP